MRRRFYLDVAERILWTAAQGFCAEWIVTSTFDSRSFKVAGVAAAISAAKCVIATKVGSPFSASTVPEVGP